MDCIKCWLPVLCDLILFFWVLFWPEDRVMLGWVSGNWLVNIFSVGCMTHCLVSDLSVHIDADDPVEGAFLV